jgi:hypothetical protein
VSGDGYVMAGIYFSLDKTSDTVCGFVHAHGHVDIFGIVSLDIDVHVSVCYLDGDVVGSATIVVHVEVLFFSEDVSLTATYHFAGSGHSSKATNRLSTHVLRTKTGALRAKTTKFCDFDPDQWREYFQAFAA